MQPLDLSSCAGSLQHRWSGCAALLVALGAALVSTVVWGIDTVWPLYFVPLIGAALLFYEVGALAISFILANAFVISYALSHDPVTGALGRVVVALVGSLAAGLLAGFIARRHARLRERLAASSLTDRLTGLYNYGTFVDFLRREIETSDRYGGDLSLIMLDLDHFKTFNDAHGHQAGNTALRLLGDALRSQLREADIAARYGGEEFAILARADEAQAFELAQRLRCAVACLDLDEAAHGSSITISAGVATYPSVASTSHELVECADAALYESKRRGRDCVTRYAGSASSAGRELSA